MSVTDVQDSARGWVSREVEAMEAAWASGGGIMAEDVLAARPDADPECAIRLIYEETCLRREAGQNVATSEVVARFPRFSSELRALFECDRLIRSPRGMVDYPEAGEMLGPFLLLAELGRGRAGRHVSGFRREPGRPAGRREADPRRRRRTSGLGPAAAHAHRAALFRAQVPGARPSRAVHAVSGRNEPGANSG